MPETLENKLAAMLRYCELLSAGVIPRQNEAFNSYLDDPEVALWVLKMRPRINPNRFTGV